MEDSIEGMNVDYNDPGTHKEYYLLVFKLANIK